MNFKFEVGTEEKHLVEFHFSNWWGGTYILVDGESEQKYLVKLYGNLLGLFFLIVFLVLYVISEFELILLSLAAIFTTVPMVISSIIWWKKFPITLTVGKKERHEVQIERVYKIFPAFKSAEYNIYIDNELFRTFKT
jgi:hypothetical protein